MESSFQLMTAYDMFYYVKFTALSIKTICRALSLLVLRDRALQIVLMERAVNLT